MARKLRPNETPPDLDWLLGQALLAADMRNLPLTAAHIAMALDSWLTEDPSPKESGTVVQLVTESSRTRRK